MRKNTIFKTIYGAYAYPVPLAVRLERNSRKGNIKQAWNIYTTPGKYRTNDEMKHTYKKPLARADMVEIAKQYAERGETI